MMSGLDRSASAALNSSAGDVNLFDREGPATLVGWLPTTRHIRSGPLGLHDAAFIHQHIVDAYAVHAARPTSRSGSPRRWWGCFPHVEHGLTGRQVQRVHHILAAQRPAWPRFVLSDDRGSITVHDVIAEPPGERRDRAIEAWATSTCNACLGHRESHSPFESASSRARSCHELYAPDHGSGN
jgi:hypothetical protein